MEKNKLKKKNENYEKIKIQNIKILYRTLIKSYRLEKYAT